VRVFACESCEHLVFFENSRCLHCHHPLGFAWPLRELETLTQAEGRLTRLHPEVAGPDAEVYRCANAGVAECNWLVARPQELCFSCALTRRRPADSDSTGLREFAAAEAAKRRLLFELGELGLPVNETVDGPTLAFDLLSSANEPVITGHADGVITLDLAESDDVHRAQMRIQLGEPYRTLLGHMRHEIGHYYFPLLTADPQALERCRELFGDEREDYGKAMERYYDTGPTSDWQRDFVSAYATMHPSEDWAETFSHYLHIWDTIQTAAAYGVRVRGPAVISARQRGEEFSSAPDAHAENFAALLEDWLPLTYALNGLNRSMGLGDLYPFVLTGAVIAKLSLVEDLVTRCARSVA
jgi:hypothetical protein